MSVRTHKLILLTAFILIGGCHKTHISPPVDAVVDYDTRGSIQVEPGEKGDFFAGAVYDRSVTEPVDILGFRVGARAAHYEDITRCFRTWADESKRVILEPYAQSHEGRELYTAVISSKENIRNIEKIKNAASQLADPRRTDAAGTQDLIKNTPAIAWLGYSIHGNELSGSDASMAVAYHLIASESMKVKELLDKVVIVIDPVMNPDGRERTITEIDENAGYVPNVDYASMHRGRWPYGRGNHYLFDMNRDWIAGTAPETRGRWKMMLEFRPQLVIDAHEMMALDTFLFYPASEPINPHRPASIMKWQKIFADNHAVTFDAHGFSYYTREWVEGWYPGYSDAWASLNSSIGMLYEQARFGGQSIRRESGKILPYSYSVKAQAVSSMSDLFTLMQHREDILRDFAANRALPLSGDFNRVFALRKGLHPDRERAFISTLMMQGIEVFEAEADFEAPDAQGVFGKSEKAESFRKGTYLIPEAQPQGLLLRALLDLDPRYSKQVLLDERHELERKNESKIYDITAWDLAHAFDIDGFWITDSGVARKAVMEIEDAEAGVVAPSEGAITAWVVDGSDDASIAFAAAALEDGIRIRVSEKAFTTAGKKFPRGSLLVRRSENGESTDEKLVKAAVKAGVVVHATTSGRSPDDGPDLGGPKFHFLYKPRVAVLANAPIGPTQYGHVWHHMDGVLGMQFTLLDVQALEWYDLRRYNVIIIPPTWQSLAAVLKPHAKKLSAWVRSGGSLIAIGSSAAAVTNKDLGLGTVRLMRDVLTEVDGYREAAQMDLKARNIKVDPEIVWGEKKLEPREKKDKAVGDKKSPDALKPSPGAGPDAVKKALERKDQRLRLFSPRGTIFRGLANLDSWMTYGLRDEIPFIFRGDNVFVARAPAHAPVRFATEERLRLSGLVWPEAVSRLALSAYVTTERIGQGQVILFSWDPVFRGYFKGTARIFSNAVVYGPSLGASQPAPW